MQDFLRNLPWRDVIDSGLSFLPCTVALLAEMRKGKESIFYDYLKMIPTDYSNAIAPWPWDDGDDDSSPSIALLSEISLAIASSVSERRRLLRLIHAKLAPPFLSLRDLSVAAAVVSSRSFTRRNPPPPPPGSGPIASKDLTRILPPVTTADGCWRMPT